MIVSIYKPKNMSSYDVIRALKKKYPEEKIGHGGTLDPLAEGVLVVAIGRQDTKKLNKVLNDAKKTYKATIELGKISKTDDAEGPIKLFEGLSRHGGTVPIPNARDIYVALTTFQGNILQTPPRYSAVKIKGVPAYKLARIGEQFELTPKQVIIDSIKLISYQYPILKILVVSGAGVYIRSLARDMGKKLKTGAYLTRLVRTQVGTFDVDSCKDLCCFNK